MFSVNLSSPEDPPVDKEVSCALIMSMVM